MICLVACSPLSTGIPISIQEQVDPMVAFSSVCRGELLALARWHNFDSTSSS
jgi:hypothetical protein